MLILLPPSEGKTRPQTGPILNLNHIEPGSTQLAHARQEVLHHLQNVSSHENALNVLGVGKRIAPEIAANTQLTDAPCAPAREIYSGVLYEAGNLAQEHANLTETGRARVQTLVQSALFGVVDLASPIPAYRLSIGVKLPPLGALATWWRPHLDPVMSELADHHQIVVDARSGQYRQAWPTTNTKADVITVSAVRIKNGKRSVVSHAAKRYRGILAGALLNRAEQTENTFDYVLQTARTLIGDEVSGIEVEETNGALDLVIVTRT
ncbi:MAG: peroxide stress protein YaaA [Actinomycetaceae bacterium]|nr:peroxide stress protein YaaA [Actinomycetaceae bacterium]